MEKLKRAAYLILAVTLAFAALTSIHGCNLGQAPTIRSSLEASADVRRFICGAWESLETEIQEYDEAARAKEEEGRRANEEAEESSERERSAESSSTPTATSSRRTSGGSAVEPTPPTVPAPPEPTDG